MDTKKIIEMLTKNPAAAGAIGGLAGSLLGSVLTGGRVKAGGIVKAGGLATIGYLAYQAWQRHQAKQTGTPVPADAEPSALGANNQQTSLPARLPSAFDLTQASQSAAAMRVTQAMIAAAKADGTIDAAERERVLQRVEQAGLAPEDRDYVLKLLTQPIDLDSVVGGVNSPEVAAEIYAAAVLTVHPANRAERAYLDMLAARLNIEPGLVAELERGVMVAVPAAGL